MRNEDNDCALSAKKYQNEGLIRIFILLLIRFFVWRHLPFISRWNNTARGWSTKYTSCNNSDAGWFLWAELYEALHLKISSFVSYAQHAITPLRVEYEWPIFTPSSFFFINFCIFPSRMLRLQVYEACYCLNSQLACVLSWDGEIYCTIKLVRDCVFDDSCRVALLSWTNFNWISPPSDLYTLISQHAGSTIFSSYEWYSLYRFLLEPMSNTN